MAHSDSPGFQGDLIDWSDFWDAATNPGHVPAVALGNGPASAASATPSPARPPSRPSNGYKIADRARRLLLGDPFGDNLDAVIEVVKQNPKLGDSDGMFMTTIKLDSRLRDELESLCDLDVLRALLTLSRKQSMGRHEEWHPDMMKRTADTPLFRRDPRVKPKYEAVIKDLIQHAERSEDYINAQHDPMHDMFSSFGPPHDLLFSSPP